MTNKILLAAIALGLWANAAVSYVRPARATELVTVEGMSGIEGRLAIIGDQLRQIEGDLHRIMEK